MALPNPLPDNPVRWDGWKTYNSEDCYARLCLSFDSNPSAEQIEDHCRQLLVWWQKKLPLKNQPSNPLAQLLRGGLDEAPRFLAQARTLLLDPDSRARIDAALHERTMQTALVEFTKLLTFAVAELQLRDEDEQRLYLRGAVLGLRPETMQAAVEAELARLGAVRVATPAAAAAVPAPPAALAPSMTADPAAEFRRILQMSRLCLEGEDMTDDQRDAMCNLGESLGLTGGEAEDLIDEYLEQVGSLPLSADGGKTATLATPALAPSRVGAAPRHAEPAAPVRPVPEINTSPLARAEERQRHPSFHNGAKMEMLLIPSGNFRMGSAAREAQPHEQPVTPVTQSCFYLARFPVTNTQYELFDRAHVNKRAPWADGEHPVVYVSSRDAENFCKWLGAKEGKKYRLPTEAEWEYAARGTDERVFPWGDSLEVGSFANFADRRTTFAWRDQTADDGFAQTAPVGSFPRGASPFGLEDMAGNVFEWCLDCFESYKGRERINPRGSPQGTKRVYRGGSWKSRASSLRGSARAFNLPDYCSNDVGFRVVCEIE